MKFSILIPCFNESDVIDKTADAVLSYLSSNEPGGNYEILFINDGSTDDTLSVLNKLASQHQNIEVISLPVNSGRGAAVISGIKNATGDFIIILDADLSYDVQHIGEMLKEIRRDPYLDVVVVSPYMKGGIVKNVPLLRRLLSRMANWILAGFFPNKLSTVTCIVRAYRTDLIRRLPLFENGKEQHLEILRKLFLINAKITEIPGRLIWKEHKLRSKRQSNRTVVDSTFRHLWWGFLSKPTLLLKYPAFLLIVIGFYELGTLIFSFERNFYFSGSLADSIWQALSASFTKSPHTVVIAATSLILGFQILSFIFLFQILKLKQEETIRHLLALWDRIDRIKT